MKKIYTIQLLMLLLCSNIGAFGQETPSLRDRANQFYKEFQYAKAAAIYEKLVDVNKPKQADLENLADCYQKMNNYQMAEQCYARIVADSTSGPENLLRYAMVLKSNAKYAEAKQSAEQYAAKTGSQDSARSLIQSCDSALLWMQHATTHVLRNESAVNTALSEFAAYAASDGSHVFYVGEPDAVMFKNVYGWTGNPFLRIYNTRRNSDNSLQQSNLSDAPFNNEAYHVGPVAINPEGTSFYVTRTYSGKLNEKVKDDKKNYRMKNLELYIYTKNGDGTWTNTPFPYNKVEEYSVGHAALSSDGEILYFVSDMPGGQGGTDIWYCERQPDGSWGSPQNAGPVVNSKGDEMFPSIAKDGTLYFSSNGWPGMGNLDVFSAKGAKGQWSNAINMHYPVNSPGDDFAYIVNQSTNTGEMGYLSSNRQGGVGSDDIYSFTYQKPKYTVLLVGNVYDKDTNESIKGANITLSDATKTLVEKQQSGENGAFLFEVDPEKSYSILGEKIGFYPNTVNTTTNGISPGDTVKVALYLDSLKKGKTFRLDNIYYDFNKYNIRPDAAVILDGLVKIMQDNPTLKIELSSHTDSRGSDQYNQTLSQKRAQAAVDYLVSKGITRDRMIAKGYGESRLLNRCANGVKCSEADHQLNRRTEFTVLER